MRQTIAAMCVATFVWTSVATSGDEKPAAGWATIQGKVIWAQTAPPPQNKTLSIPATNQDLKHCSGGGEIPDEEIVVDPKTMAVANVFAYLRKVEPDDIHPDYPKTEDDVAKKDAEEFQKLNGMSTKEAADSVQQGKVDVAKLKSPVTVDQPNCRYVPHALVVRVGQTVLVKNADSISHNVSFTGLEDANRSNLNMPPKSVVFQKLAAENQPIIVKCNSHGWMEMRTLALPHPYAAATNASGEFTLKNVKPGEHTLVVRNADGRFINRSLKVTVAADEVKKIEIKWEDKK